ncbi:aspartate/glutamate racemase family protein [Geodermatophilus nigrescens]|uniref:Aspartate racemase n=1 Tax=Geodermatophilus nigrescens TaxID=1070870 RepID=A0A1M5I2D4_9ACTN|nr:amino acid racemase [Geodermatophilus nigrescens]SHG22425.1 aspartate racemase [Geodermatophilus nigrescens]
MRTIGLLGGMSWESTALYYRVANELVRDRLGGLASASLLVRSLDFRAVRACQVEDRWDDAAALLAAEARALEAAGAGLVLLCTNYMHKVAPALEAVLTVPFLHIADAVAAAAPGPVVGLLGAAGTVREPFYRDRLAAHGLTVLTPPDDDVERVDAAIFGELCRGVLSDGTRAELRAVVARLADRGAQAIALSCTELELLLGPDDSPVPLLPSARLHVTAAVDRALALPAGVPGGVGGGIREGMV